MFDQLVFIPCRLDRRDARHALIDDADGWPRKVIGPLGRVGKRLVVAAQWVREAAGRHLVEFDDGAKVWVTYGPGPAEHFIPLGHICQSHVPAEVRAGVGRMPASACVRIPARG